jgi:hypothetical protein
MVKLAKYQHKITSKTYSLQRKEKGDWTKFNNAGHVSMTMSSMHNVNDVNNLNKKRWKLLLLITLRVSCHIENIIIIG